MWNKKINIKRISSRGFTLIEILVVVAIIAVLASIVIVGLSGFRSRGRDARRVSDLRTVQNVLELYYAKNRTYPSLGSTPAWSDIVTALAGPGAGLGVSNIPSDPLPGKAYGYCSYGSDQHYVLEATLEQVDAQVGRDSYKGVDCSPGGVSCSSGELVYCIQF
ncbi:MAG: prepilin-type N-terminal cleavage/methylation domain-containing protein [Candidatus Wolfebacteria bacterium]|nr:prepilin-type N-terminal cleavage/methylation domain-containing protein [Candidatus Wolfebacteria bacterium]